MCPDCHDKGTIALFTSVVPCLTCNPSAGKARLTDAKLLDHLNTVARITSKLSAPSVLPAANNAMPHFDPKVWYRVAKLSPGQMRDWIVAKDSMGKVHVLEVPHACFVKFHALSPKMPVAPDYWLCFDLNTNQNWVFPI